MKARRLLPLVSINLRRDLRGSLLAAFGIAIGIGALAFFVALGGGVGQVVREKIFPADARQVQVVPPAVSLNLFGGVRLDDAAVQRLRALDGVEEAHRRMQVRVPAISRYDGVFFGKRLRMGLEILAEGVDPELVQEDLFEGRRFEDPQEGGTIPVLVSGRLVEIYNGSFARARGLPVLQPGLLAGFQFPVTWGRSHVTAAAASRTRTASDEAVLVGVSDRAMLEGITLPLETARRLNERFGEDATTYSSVVLVARTPDAVPAIAERVRAMGFEIDDAEKKMAERVGAGVAITTAALALLSLLICVLAAANIALSLGAAIRSRAREIGILRAVGATSRDVAQLVLAEAAVLGVAGGAVGALLAFGAATAVDAAAQAWLPDFPFKPESFFAFSPWLVAGAIGLGALAALAGAWPPARRAARLDPARAIGG